MTRIYECMFLIDNDAVRAGWPAAKGLVDGLVKKHGGESLSARRWDERRLAYPIRRRKRATFLLSWCDLPPDSMGALRRDLDIDETVLRYLITSSESVPAEELALTAAEDSQDFVVPEPPTDDHEESAVVAEAPAPAPAPAPAAAEPKTEAAKTTEEQAADKPAEKSDDKPEKATEPVAAGPTESEEA